MMMMMMSGIILPRNNFCEACALVDRHSAFLTAGNDHFDLHVRSLTGVITCAAC